EGTPRSRARRLALRPRASSSRFKKRPGCAIGGMSLTLVIVHDLDLVGVTLAEPKPNEPEEGASFKGLVNRGWRKGVAAPWSGAVVPGRWWRGLLVLHAAFDVAELGDGEGDHDGHEDHRLRRRAAEVEAFDAVAEHLVDQD